MATAPAFAATPKIYVGQLTTLDAGYNNPTTAVVTLFTAGGAGEKVLEVTVECAATSAAAVVRLFISKDGGTNKRMFDEFLLTAVTGSATAVQFRTTKVYDNLVLELNDVMYATTSVSQTTNVWVATAQF